MLHHKITKLIIYSIENSLYLIFYLKHSHLLADYYGNSIMIKYAEVAGR